ncbi:MAG: hypothetical protein KJ607_11260 [Bacteroidetes bacterium]|nr:hypothetical protein [Bacteroidota bacterium]
MDKKAPLQVVKEITIGNLQALADRIMDLFSYDGLVVKAKIPGNRRVYMCYNEPNSVVDGRSFRRNKYRFRSVCGGDLNEAEVAFKTRSNAGYSYRLARLEDVKYSRFRNLYIVRKKDLMATESSGLMSRAD